ncbi:MAG TPA: hypothetical protein VGI12_03840 [Vicinamibacterales bacterium]|jgi:hypothetical protein
MTRRAFVTWAGVTLFFLTLTAAMAWPMVRHMDSQAPQHQDVYFNMWRLRWFAHASTTSPAHVFDANIFYPEKDTLAYSDAMLVEGLVAAPFAALNPVAVQNVMILLPMALSGVALFALCRYLTGSPGAGLVAGVAFTLAPFRFEHIMHMELQWTIWMPLAFLALHRLCDTGRWRHGLSVGLCLALQMLSCIYYGIFLGTLLVAGAAMMFFVDRRAALKPAVTRLAAGLAIALVIAAVYARPFQRVHAIVGDRPIEEVHTYSAQPSNYTNVLEGNWLYGNPGRPGLGERRLFPGAIVTLAAIVGLLLRRPSARVIVYLLLLVLAFDLSLGYSGISYPIVSRLVPPYRGLRALARLGVFVLLFLSILAAYGYAFVVETVRPALRIGLCTVLIGGMLVEYATTLQMAEFVTASPPIYRVLAHSPRGVVAEVPMAEGGQTSDARAAYLSTFHWYPLVNGYSGNFPGSYLARIERMQEFPGERAFRQLRHDGVRYLIVHEKSYTASRIDTIRAALAEAGAADLGEFDAGEDKARLYRLR